MEVSDSSFNFSHSDVGSVPMMSLGKNTIVFPVENAHIPFEKRPLACSQKGSSQLWVDLVHMFEEAIHERQRYYQASRRAESCCFCFVMMVCSSSNCWVCPHSHRRLLFILSPALMLPLPTTWALKRLAKVEALHPLQYLPVSWGSRWTITYFTIL